MAETIAVEQKEKTAQFVWTGFILLFFVIQAIVWTVAISITSRDPSHAVVAGYDEKALNWDDERALRLASANLGWRAEIVIDAASDIRGNHAITIKLNQQDKLPVKNATVELKAFHRALAGQPQQIVLSEVSDGVFEGQIQIRKSGLWQFEGIAHQSDNAYVIEQHHFLEVSK